MTTIEKAFPSWALRTAVPIGLVCALLFATPASAAGPTGISPIAPSEATPADQRETLPDSILHADGAIEVFVQTAGQSALDVHQQTVAAGASEQSAEAAAVTTAEGNEGVTDEVEEAIVARDPEASILYSSAYSVPGLAVSTTPDVLKELADREDVVKISPIVTRSLELPSPGAEPANAASDALTRAVDTWQQTNNTGRGVTVAVIDTGIDYTHATFGGPGTTETYQTALASTDAPDPSWFDGSKYLGGWDFAGGTYNGTQGSTAYNPVPSPDANPIDGPGGNHGTHVAGTAVGYGVTNDEQTFRGDYTDLNSESVRSDFSIGPGSAPEAGVIALKVFGDNGGSTSLTGAALEWIATEIASGTEIDIVNMSLGTDYGAVDDPENAKLEVLMDAGVLPVVAAGNAGDVTDVSGSPGNTARALTVAASSSGSGFGDAITAYIGDPSTVQPVNYLAQFSQNYYSSTFSVMQRVRALADPENLDGCSPFSAEDAERVAGKIAWLAWDDNDVACGSTIRFDNAQKAGAIAVVVESQSNGWETGIAGNQDIPGAQLSADAVTALRPALDADTLTIKIDSSARSSTAYENSSRVDTLASFSSRGTHGSIDDSLKPDVAAPGVNVMSAANGTGTGRRQLSGTSMATPHVAGLAALVKKAHPVWGPDRIKQQIMNTAVIDIVTGGSESIPYGPARSGTGRVNALSAVTSTTTIASVENDDLVSASFGVVEVGDEPFSATRTIRIRNEGTSTRDLSLAYEARTQTPGVRYELSDDSVSVTAGGSAEVTLTMRVDDPSALRRTLDPTMSAAQGGVPRQFVADASGYVTATAADGEPPIRLSVFVAPKPVSNMSVSGITFTGDDGSLTAAGRSLDQGEASERYQSLMVPLVLGTTDPDDIFPANSAQSTLESIDLLAVGASSTAPQVANPSDGILTIGIQTDGDWARMSPLSYPMVQLDLNGDTRSDFAIILRPGGQGDAPVAVTVDVITGQTVDQRPVNGLFAEQGTNVFDNNVLTLSTSLAALGYTPDTTQTTVRYIVQTRSYYAPAYDDTYRGSLVDVTSAASINVYHPAYWFGSAGAEAATFADAEGTLPVHRADGATGDVLVLHLHNGDGQRAQLVTPTVEDGGTTPEPGTSPEPTSAPTPAPTSTTPGGFASGGGSGSLAQTGFDGSPLPWVGLGLTLLAVGVVVWSRRRRASTATDDESAQF